MNKPLEHKAETEVRRLVNDALGTGSECGRGEREKGLWDCGQLVPLLELNEDSTSTLKREGARAFQPPEDSRQSHGTVSPQGVTTTACDRCAWDQEGRDFRQGVQAGS